MNKKKRLQYFKEYLEICEQNDEYVGLGNPCANILLVDKEPSVVGDDKEHIHKNIRDVKACFHNDDLHCLFRQDKPQNATHTWNLYQKLIDYVFDRKCEYDDKTDFCTYAFTTELNNTVSKSTANAKQKYRLNTMRESLFIQDFPVIILACSNYIHNVEGDWQINDNFSVKFDIPGGAHTDYSKGNWFYTHHSQDYRKLVIHTRQLSQNCDDKLLRDIASIINRHLIQL